MRRRDFLSLIAMGSAVSRCVSQRKSQRIEFVGPPEPTIEDRVAEIRSLRFDDIEKTPYDEPINVTVFYETEHHPAVDRDLLETALPLVQDFYKEFANINIRFTAVDSLQDAQIDNQRTFGISYVAPEVGRQKAKELIAKHQNAYHPKRSHKDICRSGPSMGRNWDHCDRYSDSVTPWEADEFADSAKQVGTGFATYGTLIVHTNLEYLQALRSRKDNINTLRAQAPDLSGFLPERADAVSLAGTISHELGHIFGLYHTDIFEDDDMPDIHSSPEYKDLHPALRDVPNLMSKKSPIVITGPNVEDIKRYSIKPNIPLGRVVNERQVTIMHNRLRGGVVYERIMEDGVSEYLHLLQEANDLTAISPTRKLLQKIREQRKQDSQDSQ